MSLALSSGVTGLQAYQEMLDVAGNNLANVNSTAFKASRITFAELLSETMKKACEPTGAVGGTNPQQMGSGVGVSGIAPILSQGNIVSTGNPLDVAIEGEGYFALSDGQQSIYTRAGAFAVDASSYLVDPATGYRVQRIGSEGQADFQSANSSDIYIPYNVGIPAQATSQIVISGNLRANAGEDTSGIPENVLTSSIEYTTTSGGRVTGSTTLGELASGTFVNASIKVTGYKHDGTALAETDIPVTESTTLDSFLSSLDTVLGSDNATANLVDGKICITDIDSGYSRSDVKLEFSNGGSADLTMPGYFEISIVGGEEVRNVSITVYDSQGGTHVLSGAFVRTDTPNAWDLVLTSIDGEVHEITFGNRRIEGINFNTDGSYSGLSGSDSAQFVITFAHDAANPQTIEFDLGTAGKLTGLTQFAEQSTAAARGQDGYGVGSLSGVSVNNEGIIIGAFSNGIKKNIAALQIALFQNPAALESTGGGYFTRSANSGDPVGTQGLSSGAGRIHGGALEKSNVDVATEFVNMIQAQNGFQANARTIRVANDILRELSNLIR